MPPILLPEIALFEGFAFVSVIKGFYPVSVSAKFPVWEYGAKLLLNIVLTKAKPSKS
jgi:hypothetical protein